MSAPVRLDRLTEHQLQDLALAVRSVREVVDWDEELWQLSQRIQEERTRRLVARRAQYILDGGSNPPAHARVGQAAEP